MADVEFNERGSGAPLVQPGQVQQIVNWAGALVSVALVVGVAIWGYRLAVRDVAGVPVIRALQGPMRITPEDPGGKIAQNEGLAVNAIAGDQPVPDAPNRVVLAPKPIMLTTDDRAVDETTGASDPVAAAVAAARSATAATAAPAEGGAVAVSPRPAPRPAGLIRVAPGAQAQAAPIEVAADSLAAGTRLVQLGAFPDIGSARAAWVGLAGRFDALMEGKSRVVQEARSGGRVFYRLRAAGFDDEAEARQFCAALAAGNAACIPVILR